MQECWTLYFGGPPLQVGAILFFRETGVPVLGSGVVLTFEGLGEMGGLGPKPSSVNSTVVRVRFEMSAPQNGHTGLFLSTKKGASFGLIWASKAESGSEVGDFGFARYWGFKSSHQFKPTNQLQQSTSWVVRERGKHPMNRPLAIHWLIPQTFASQNREPAHAVQDLGNKQQAAISLHILANANLMNRSWAILLRPTKWAPGKQTRDVLGASSEITLMKVIFTGIPDFWSACRDLPKKVGFS